MFEKYLEDLRKGRRKLITLPFLPEWTSQEWEILARYPDDYAQSLYTAGKIIGDECLRCWKEIEEELTDFDAPILVRGIIDVVNVQLLQVALKRFNITSSSEFADIPVIDQVSDATDCLSELVFFLLKRRRKLGYELSLPHQVTKHGYEDAAHRIFQSLIRINSLKFCFDHLLYLEGGVDIDGSTLSLRMPSLSAEDSLRFKANILFNRSQSLRSSNSADDAFFDPHKVVSGITFNETRPYFHLTYAHQAPHLSQIYSRRILVGSAYLFRTLSKIPVGRDVAVCWDILCSLCNASIHTSSPSEALQLVQADFEKKSLIKLVAEAASITPQRARIALEQLILKTGSTDGIWSKPLISVDSDHLKICFPAFCILDINRFLDLAIKNLSSASDRGLEFHETASREISANLRQYSNEASVEFFPDNHALHKAIGLKKLQTDFIVRVGDTLFVGEAKSTSHIGTFRELDSAKDGIKTALKQVRDRIGAIHNNMNKIKTSISWPQSDELKLRGLIVTNSVFFECSEHDDIAIVDLRTLTSVIKHDKMPLEDWMLDISAKLGIFQLSDGHIVIHNTERPLEETLFKALKSPPYSTIRLNSFQMIQSEIRLGHLTIKFPSYTSDVGKVTKPTG